MNAGRVGARGGLTGGATDDQSLLDALCAALSVDSPKLMPVLDDFHELLAPRGAEFLSDVERQLFEALVKGARRGKMILTSRYPVPEFERVLHRCDVGPLSVAKTGKLLLRLGALKLRDATTVLRRIGGHPRMLEYLDAVLSLGEGRLL